MSDQGAQPDTTAGGQGEVDKGDSSKKHSDDTGISEKDRAEQLKKCMCVCWCNRRSTYPGGSCKQCEQLNHQKRSVVVIYFGRIICR